MKTGNRQSGFTMLELLIVLIISGIIAIGLMRLYKSSVWSYSLQNQLMEMNQNANYTLKRLSEVLTEAGAGLTNRLQVITPFTDSSGFTIAVNPRGGSQTIKNAIAVKTKKLQVDDAAGFIGCDTLVRLRANTSIANDFIRVSAVDTAKDTLTLTDSTTFSAGDTLYPWDTQRFYTNSANLCMNGNSSILAENIDSLKILFYDSLNVRTTDWSRMKLAKIYVVARTAQKDPGYKLSNDKYRRITLSSTFRLKNKLVQWQ